MHGSEKFNILHRNDQAQRVLSEQFKKHAKEVFNMISKEYNLADDVKAIVGVRYCYNERGDFYYSLNFKKNDVSQSKMKLLSQITLDKAFDGGYFIGGASLDGLRSNYIIGDMLILSAVGLSEEQNYKLLYKIAEGASLFFRNHSMTKYEIINKYKHFLESPQQDYTM